MLGGGGQSGFLFRKRNMFQQHILLIQILTEFTEYFGGSGSYLCMATGLVGQLVLSFTVQSFVTLG